MNSDDLLLQTRTSRHSQPGLSLQNVPPRRRRAMPVQTITAWTPVSLLAGIASWLTTATPLTAPAQNDIRG